MALQCNWCNSPLILYSPVGLIVVCARWVGAQLFILKSIHLFLTPCPLCILQAREYETCQCNSQVTVEVQQRSVGGEGNNGLCKYQPVDKVNLPLSAPFQLTNGGLTQI